jgi:ribosomal protein S12 methylthiotransferase accessory factor
MIDLALSSINLGVSYVCQQLATGPTCRSRGERGMELKVTLEGGKRVATRIGNHRIITDQPTKHGGDDSAPAPYDLFMASIGTCAGFYVQSYCESKGFDASGIEVTLSPRRDPKSKQIIAFETTIHIPPELPEKLHTALKKVAEQCAVKKTIMNNPEFIVETVTRAV